MLIISKHRDYYDGVAGTTGIDKTIVYERHETVIENGNEFPKIFNHKNHVFGKSYRDNPFQSLSSFKIKREMKKMYQDYNYFIVGFCGKLYIGWKLYSIIESERKVMTTITYEFDQIKTLLTSQSYYGNLEDNVKMILNYDILPLFRELNAPVFVYDYYHFDKSYQDVQKGYIYHNKNDRFCINPVLKDYDFGKVFDAFQVFQEIQMFLSGVLGSREKDIVVIEDKYKIEQHGFDKKWSFRKPPENER